MSKQDRQGIRSPADFERKHSKVLSGKDDNNARQNQQIEQLAQSMEGNTSAFNYSIQQLNARLSKVEDSVLEMRNDNTTSLLAERLSEAEQAITDLQSADTAIGGRVTTLEGKSIDHGLSISKLEERMTAVETTLASLEARVTALEGV